ncbi:acetyl-CoA synthetase-like protein [Lenzites betulinus]|nr:acetyl-CoA synthetase-like protein [Lenzites betulinus]
MSTANAIPTVEADGGPLAPIPDDVTIPQFVFDGHHPLGGQALHDRAAPWFIEDETGRELTGDKIRARVWGLANALSLRWNIGNDAVVCAYGPNHVDYPVVIWAAHRLGGIFTGANPAYTVDELVYQIQTSKATVLFVWPEALQAGLEAARIAGIPDDRVILYASGSGGKRLSIEDLIMEGLAQPRHWVEPRLKPGEGKTKIALLFFSSGTTGRPKAVMIPHYAVIANVIQMKQYSDIFDKGKPLSQCKYAPGDRVLGVLPFYHIYGVVVGLHFYMLTGATVIIVTRFGLEKALQSIVKYKVAHLTLVPPMIVLLCKDPIVKKYDLGCVKLTTSGAAPLSAELTKQVARVLPNSGIGQGYGMTETCTVVSFPQLDMRIGTPGSAGYLLPGIRIRILKADGSWGGPNETGQIVVTGPSMALGYLDNKEATEETFKDGWVYTGDEGYVTEKKVLYIVDRIKELIKVRGFQVAPAELEGLLLDHPDVADVCVIGAPDEYSGELPFAFVTPKPEARARIARSPQDEEQVREAIMTYVTQHKTQFKWLAGVMFIDVVPKNPSGKLLRRLLRDQLKDLMKEGKVKIVPPTKARSQAKL